MGTGEECYIFWDHQHGQVSTRERLVYCYKCGKQIPDESAFCNNCGATLKAGATPSSPPVEVRWEAGITRCKVVKGRFFKDTICVFVLEAMGPQGSYRAATSEEFTYPLSPHARDLEAYPKVGPARQHIFNKFVGQLIADGWEPVPNQGYWHEQNFRRRVK